MSATEFLVMYASLLVCMLASRCVPMLVLKGRRLPDGLSEALGLIPPAAFAALIANDLLEPDMFAGGVLAGLVPLLAAAAVVVVARTTRSLVWCAVTGVVAYALLASVLPVLS